MSSKYKGKSKFTQKRKAVAPLQREEPVFQYISDCHNTEAVKPPCEHTADDRAKRQYSQSTLGTWKCTTCRRKCKVRRRKNKPDVVESADIAVSL